MLIIEHEALDRRVVLREVLGLSDQARDGLGGGALLVVASHVAEPAPQRRKREGARPLGAGVVLVRRRVAGEGTADVAEQRVVSPRRRLGRSDDVRDELRLEGALRRVVGQRCAEAERAVHDARHAGHAARVPAPVELREHVRERLTQRCHARRAARGAPGDGTRRVPEDPVDTRRGLEGVASRHLQHRAAFSHDRIGIEQALDHDQSRRALVQVLGEAATNPRVLVGVAPVVVDSNQVDLVSGPPGVACQQHHQRVGEEDLPRLREGQHEGDRSHAPMLGVSRPRVDRA
jgi:hypothetical protein